MLPREVASVLILQLLSEHQLCFSSLVKQCHLAGLRCNLAPRPWVGEGLAALGGRRRGMGKVNKVPEANVNQSLCLQVPLLPALFESLEAASYERGMI